MALLADIGGPKTELPQSDTEDHGGIADEDDGGGPLLSIEDGQPPILMYMCVCVCVCVSVLESHLVQGNLCQ